MHDRKENTARTPCGEKMTTTKHTNGTRVQKWIAFLQSVAADVAEAQAERYWDYTDGAFSDWWTQGPDDTVDLQYFGSCSDHASITGATGANGIEKLAFGEGIPSVYIFWGDNIGDGRNDVTEQNYHVVGNIYEWPADEDVFTAVGDSEPFSGNYSIERAQILASVFALSVYNTAASPVAGIEDGGTYYGDTEFTVAYNYRNNVTVDGQAVAVDETGAYALPADNAQHTVVVTDVSGETRTYTVQVDQVVLPFTDIEQDAYYYDALVWGYSNGIVLGTTETTFSPDENVTRAGHCVPVSSGRRAGVRREGTIYGCAVGCVLCTGFGLGGREQDRLRRFGNRF